MVNNREFPTRLMFDNIPAPPHPRWRHMEIKHGKLQEFPWEGHDNDEAETIVILNGKMRFVVREADSDRKVCDVHLDSGDVLVQPGGTSHKAYRDGEPAMLVVIELAH